MKRIYESPEGGLHRQFGDVQDARQDRVASDEPQLIQPWKADVQAQHDSQHEPVQAHGTGNPLGCQRLLHQGSEIEFLQHGDHRQQSSVGSQILTVEVVGRGSVDSIGFGSRAFGALFLGRFLVILCLVCNHLGDLLGSVLRSANFAELLFYPNVSGVPKWFSSRLSSGRRLITCIAQVLPNRLALNDALSTLTDILHVPWSRPLPAWLNVAAVRNQLRCESKWQEVPNPLDSPPWKQRDVAFCASSPSSRAERRLRPFPARTRIQTERRVVAGAAMTIHRGPANGWYPSHSSS